MSNPNTPNNTTTPDPNVSAPLTEAKTPWYRVDLKLREGARKIFNPNLDDLAESCTEDDQKAFEEFMKEDTKKKPDAGKTEGTPKNVDTKGLRGLKYFMTQHDNPSNKVFRSNALTAQMLLILIRDNDTAKQHSCKSIIDKLKLDSENIIEIATVAFSNIADGLISEGDILNWLDDAKGKAVLEIIFSQVLNCREDDNQGTINNAISRLNEYIGQFVRLRALFTPETRTSGRIDYPKVLSEKMKALKTLMQTNPDNETLQKEREKILKDIAPMQADVLPIEKDTIEKLSRKFKKISPIIAPADSADAPKEDAVLTVEKLRSRGDLKEAMHTIDDLRSVFALDDETSFKAIFGGKTKVNIAEELDVVSSKMSLGSLVFGMVAAGESKDVLDELLGILPASEDEAVKAIKDVYEKIAKEYPKLQERNPHCAKREEERLYDLIKNS